MDIKQKHKGYTMNQKDAFKILGLSGQITKDDVKKAYKKACSKYHPDRNPAGLEIMKMVNVAYESLKDFEGDASITVDASKYGDEVASALNDISSLGLVIEICGAWVWVSGDTKTYKDALKKSGFKWAPKKECWYFRPSDVKRSRSFGAYSMNAIRDKYGSVQVNKREKRRLA